LGGIRTTVVSNAVGSRTTIDDEAALNRLQRAGVEIATMVAIAFEWMRNGTVNLRDFVDDDA